jgi:biotin transporter BioY
LRVISAQETIFGMAAGWLAGWLADWLAGWLAAAQQHHLTQPDPLPAVRLIDEQ